MGQRENQRCRGEDFRRGAAVRRVARLLVFAAGFRGRGADVDVERRGGLGMVEDVKHKLRQGCP